MKRVAVLLADGCEEVEAITPIDFLKRAGIEVLAVGVTGRDVIGGHGIRIGTDLTVDELSPELDAVIIPGGVPGAENIANSEDAVAVIRQVMERGKLVAAICAAPALVLGKHGMIGSRAFTCYPGFEEKVLEGRFSPERVVIDGSLLTSRGPGTAAEFAIAIIDVLVGAEAASAVHAQTLQRN